MIRYYLSEVHCKKLEVSIFINMDRILKKTFFKGGTPWFTSFRGSDPMCEFIIFKLHQNEDLCKKLEVSILKNMDRILKKTFFRGWYPLIYLLQGPSGGLTLCVSLISSSCTKMRTFVKNWRSLSSKTWTGFSKNHFSGGGTPWFTPFRALEGVWPYVWF